MQYIFDGLAKLKCKQIYIITDLLIYLKCTAYIFIMGSNFKLEKLTFKPYYLEVLQIVHFVKINI